MHFRRLHREKQPDFHPLSKFSVNNPERYTAKNGIPIYLLPLQDQEIVKIDFIFKAGDYAAKSALTPLSTLAMLQEGSLTNSGEQIAERLDFLGSYVYQQVSKDDATISICCLEKHLPETMNIITDFILNPTFPEDKFQTHISKREERYKIDIERVEVLSQKKLAEVLYGEKHPYGRSSSLEDFSSLKREELIKFHTHNYTAEKCTIVICGNPKSYEVQTLVEILKNNGIKNLGRTPKIIEPKIISDKQIKHKIEKENAVQSSINIGKILVNKTHPDFIPLQVLNTVLGGYFGSRLMTNIRENKGFTYGIGSGIISHEHSGYFIITTRVGNEVVEPALAAIYDEIKKLRTELIPQDELDMVKTHMQSTLIRNFDGAIPTSEMLKNIIGYNIDFNNYYQKYWKTIQKIQSKDLLKLANDYLNEDSMYEIVVG
ncbi:MAG: insulinase family protein [Bacteroidales bacterium]|nr:insulinase family protein [Bacteroidales bacterium]